MAHGGGATSISALWALWVGELRYKGGWIMGALIKFLHRFLSPFLTGVCMAAATVASDVPMTVVLLSAAALLGFMSLPAGGRMISRIVGVTA